MTYTAPLSDFRFILDHVVPLAPISETARFAEATSDVSEAILSEAGKLCEDILAPLNRVGDLKPAVLENGVVRTPEGFPAAYRAIAEGGWVSIAALPEHGGMGLPMMLTTAVNDMMSSACLSIQLSPLMTQGQIEALEAHASEELKALYLPKLVAGEWTGTMNLTEPQAGSDVGALRTRAEPQPDGTYAITGQKIYISWGDHDCAENIVHLVLARLPDAGPGTKGISLFLVPKFLPNADGSLGARNDLRAVSLEHKLGLHGSPTAVMEYSGATGWLVGQPHQGMKAMFTMMNNARLGVGTQGIGIAEAASQAAVHYAEARVQGRTSGPTGTILDHADVRRMLATMRADTFAARALALACAQAIDLAHATGAPEATARAALLTPIAKAFGTETGIRVAELGVQVHGGMGFIEETGVAQFARDVRVTAIYEGTNGIQAMDLVARKMADSGEAMFGLIDEIEAHAEALRHRLPDLAEPVWQASETLRETVETLLERDLEARFSGAVPFLMGFARVLGAHYHLRAIEIAGRDSARGRIGRFYIERLLPEHKGLLAQAGGAAEAVLDLRPEDLAVA
ncbi:acyl-CoA dehydrogenase [Primorskyibacter sp. S187A]|uniref:acyl-CoA dehydrogenase n=1 Tax=Primorskyibacter sp. S187A TaxID=3415130 RepID=UPI003C7E6EC5